MPVDHNLLPEYAQLFAALIARTAKDVDVLIDSLPSEESTAALQVSNLVCPFFVFLKTFRYSHEQVFAKSRVVLATCLQKGEPKSKWRLIKHRKHMQGVSKIILKAVILKTAKSS